MPLFKCSSDIDKLPEHLPMSTPMWSFTTKIWTMHLSGQMSELQMLETLSASNVSTKWLMESSVAEKSKKCKSNVKECQEPHFKSVFANLGKFYYLLIPFGVYWGHLTCTHRYGVWNVSLRPPSSSGGLSVGSEHSCIKSQAGFSPPFLMLQRKKC